MMGVSVKATKMDEKAINPRTGKRTLVKWRVMVNMGRKGRDGRYIVKKLIISGGTEAEAIQEGYDWARAHEGVSDVRGGETPFSKFAAEWLKARRESGELAASTLDSYETNVSILCEQLGELPLDAIDAATIIRAYSAIREARSRAFGKEAAPRTMLKTHRVLSQIMQHAEDLGCITRNPCARVKLPKAEPVDRSGLDDTQVACLFAAIEEAEAEGYAAYGAKELHLKETGHQNKARSSVRGLTGISYPLAVRIALMTGMRRGEVMGLEWRDISLSKAFLRVERSQTSHATQKAPKTAAGRRTVALDSDTVAALETWADFLRGVLADLGIIGRGEPLPGDVPVICSNTLEHVRVEAFSRWFRQWFDSHGFEGRMFHELRHTHASWLASNGMDVKTIQTRLGHADSSITLDWYIHPSAANDRRAADMFSSMLSDARKGGEAAPLLSVV